MESLSAELHQRAPELKALEQAIQERQKKMAGLEKTINDVKDSIYTTLSKQVQLPRPAFTVMLCLCALCISCSCCHCLAFTDMLHGSD